MREIKFRLRIDNKIVGYEKWYCGVQETEDSPLSAEPQWLYSKDGENWNPKYIYHNKKDRYTGLKDKNGVEIYEGDCPGGIWEMSYIGWCFECGGFQLFNCINECMACSGDVHWKELIHDNNDIEIIGNIHSNPELLKD